MKLVLNKPKSHAQHESCPVIFRVRVVSSKGYGRCSPIMEVDNMEVGTLDWKVAKNSWSDVSGSIGLVSTSESAFVSRNNAEDDTKVLLDKSIILPGGNPCVRVIDEMVHIGKVIEKVGMGEYDWNYYIHVIIEKPPCGQVCGVKSPLLRVLGNSCLYVRNK